MNSSAISNILIFIKENLNKIIFYNENSRNTVQMLLPENIPINNNEKQSTINLLHSSQLNNEFIKNNIKLINLFCEKTKEKNYNYKEIWITASYIPQTRKYFVDLSFE